MPGAASELPPVILSLSLSVYASEQERGFALSDARRCGSSIYVAPLLLLLESNSYEKSKSFLREREIFDGWVFRAVPLREPVRERGRESFLSYAR